MEVISVFPWICCSFRFPLTGEIFLYCSRMSKSLFTCLVTGLVLCLRVVL